MRKIDDYMTVNEAAHRWGVNIETLKERLKPSRSAEQIERLTEAGMIKAFIKPGGRRREWIISRDAMELWYGKEFKND